MGRLENLYQRAKDLAKTLRGSSEVVGLWTRTVVGQDSTSAEMVIAETLDGKAKRTIIRSDGSEETLDGTISHVRRNSGHPSRVTVFTPIAGDIEPIELSSHEF